MSLQEVTFKDFRTEKGGFLPQVVLSYELAGQPLGRAPIVLVCHALTGNSSVAGPDGWWASLIGPGQAIDTAHYTILCFNIPGNGYDERVLPRYDLFTLKDVARLFLIGLKALQIKRVEVVVGASLGGALVWQIGALAPLLARFLIPIACHYRANDWLLAQTEVQKLLLEGSKPLEHARIHGMLCYRTPHSLDLRFKGEAKEDGGLPKVLDWLHYHGRALAERFELQAYQVMTHLTSTIHVAERAEELGKLREQLHLVSIESDLLFPHYLAEETAEALGVPLYTIRSIHGHDAFLIEYDQLSSIVRSILHADLEEEYD